MTRLNLVLVLAIVASALVLIRTAYESRRLYAELDRARSQQRQLDVELKHLEAERRAQATNLRVEKVARERLAMRAATPALTFYAADPAAAETTASAPEASR